MNRNLLCMALIGFIPTLAMAQNSPGGHFVENWDLDGNGSVSVEEIAERREMVFAMFDEDENGFLDLSEYAVFDETRAADMEINAGGHGAGGGRMQEGLTLSFNDTDADGVVSRDEFIANSNAWLTMIDRNADGLVTTDDFGRQNI